MNSKLIGVGITGASLLCAGLDSKGLAAPASAQSLSSENLILGLSGRHIAPVKPDVITEHDRRMIAAAGEKRARKAAKRARGREEQR